MAGTYLLPDGTKAKMGDMPPMPGMGMMGDKDAMKVLPHLHVHSHSHLDDMVYFKPSPVYVRTQRCHVGARKSLECTC